MVDADSKLPVILSSLMTDSPLRIPTRLIFVTSAIFHYLGPAFAVILFNNIPVLGVAWLRIASASGVYAAWRRPWKVLRSATRSDKLALIAMGGTLAMMNACFYLAISRIPLATVGAIEFVAPIGLALAGIHSLRNALALMLAVGGAWLLSEIQLPDQPIGVAFAIANCVLFGFYIVLGHKFAQKGSGRGIDRIGTSMLFGLAFISPVGISGASVAFLQPVLLGAGIGVGICSSVIPYALDQVAMSRLSRSSFALLLSILPATATLIGAAVLRQIPTFLQIIGISLIVAGVAIHETTQAQRKGTIEVWKN